MKKQFISAASASVLLLTLVAPQTLAFSDTQSPMVQIIPSASANKTNIITNGTFETGDTTGWTFDGYLSSSQFTVENHKNSLQGRIYDGGTISQKVMVLGGQSYNFSMDFEQLYSGYMTQVSLIALDHSGETISTVYNQSSLNNSGNFTEDEITLPQNAQKLLIKISTGEHSEAYINNIKLTSNAQSGLINGDFETGDSTGWDFTTNYASAHLDVVQHAGSYQGRLYDGGTLSQSMVIDETEKYKFSMDYTQVSTLYTILCQVYALDGSGNRIGNSIYTQIANNSGGTFSNNNLTIPSGTVYLQVAIQTPYASDFYVDNITLDPIL